MHASRCPWNKSETANNRSFRSDAVVFGVACWIPERCLYRVATFSVFLQGVIFIVSPSTVGRKHTSAEENTVRAAVLRTVTNNPFHFLQRTYSIQMSARSSVYYETLTVLQLLKKFPAFCGKQSKFITLLTKACNARLFWIVWTQSKTPHHKCLWYI